MTTEIQTAARALMEAAGRARRDALVNLEAERIECRALIQKYDKARERLARLDAEYARVEAQKIEDIARQALGRAQKCDGDHIGPICADKQCWLRDPEEAEAEKPKPEPYRAGLPPERLRTAWAQWEEKDSGLVDFRGNEYRGTMGDGTRDQRWRPMAELGGFADRNLWAFRPHGATWARVEAMADEAERAACDHTGHCERGTSCDCKCHKPGLVYANDPKPTPAAPTLLDLTKLPPGTVCEATGQIARGSHVILPGERFAFAGSSTEFLARVRVIERDESFDVPTMVHARVVKEGGEQ